MERCRAYLHESSSWFRDQRQWIHIFLTNILNQFMYGSSLRVNDMKKSSNISCLLVEIEVNLIPTCTYSVKAALLQCFYCMSIIYSYSYTTCSSPDKIVKIEPQLHYNYKMKDIVPVFGYLGVDFYLTIELICFFINYNIQLLNKCKLDSSMSEFVLLPVVHILEAQTSNRESTSRLTIIL